ncbi:hypothetical protein ACJ8S7_005109 [Klebsiella pneumoniae]|nr:hypothetical protein [Klebsiella pneumoniae]
MNIDEARDKYNNKMKENDRKKSMRDFQLIEKKLPEAQKCINQWRHEYDIEIVSVQASIASPGYVIIAVWRTPK